MLELDKTTRKLQRLQVFVQRRPSFEEVRYGTRYIEASHQSPAECCCCCCHVNDEFFPQGCAKFKEINCQIALDAGTG